MGYLLTDKPEVLAGCNLYKYPTIFDAISDAEEKREKSKSYKFPGLALDSIKFLGPDDYQQEILELKRLEEFFNLSKQGVLLQAIQAPFYTAENKESFLKELNKVYYWGLKIREVDSDSRTKDTILKFYANLIDDSDFSIQQIAREIVLGHIQFAPKDVRDFILERWALSGLSLDKIIEQFDKETPGKWARIERPFILEELKKLAISSYETSLIFMFGSYWLLRGDKEGVRIPKKPIFHSHPNCGIETMWPSLGTLENLAGDMIYDLEKGEYGFINSPRGLTLYSGTTWSKDSFVPFVRLFIEEVKKGAEYIGGILYFPSNYTTERIPMAFFSWSLLERRTQRLISPSLLTNRDTNRTVSNKLSLVEIRERINLPKISFEKQEGELHHYDPKYTHTTGSYVLEVKK